MADNPSNDPQLDEACRQVGRFLYHFALLEETMNALIGQALKLDADQTAIVGRSVPLHKKVELLQAVIQAQPRQDEAWKQAVVSTFNKISTLNGDRNIVAHHAFCGDPSGGAVFRVAGIHQKSKALKREPVLWTPTDFETKCENAERLRAELERIRGGLMPVIYGALVQELAPLTSSVSAEVTGPA